jgi:hypothetical protein
MRIWKSNCVNWSEHFKSLAQLSYHKSIDPTSFDNWSFLNFQMWYKELINVADEQNKNSTDEQENSKVQQGEMMQNAKRSANKSSMPKSSSMKMPKSSGMKMPRIK